MKRVHVVHKTHLDLGYTDLAANVKTLYFERFIPDALRVARKLRETEAPTTLCWTVPTYVLYEYLEEASPSEVQLVEEAVSVGDVSWLGLPYTLNLELATADLLREAFGYAAELDRRFGQKTIAVKATDVPGISIAAVPLLAEAGIEVLYIGANGVDMPPDIPPVFRWIAPDGSELITLYTTGYGGTVTLDGLDDVLLMKFTLDNVGPPTEVDVLATYLDVCETYTGAEVRASTLNAFAEALLPHRDRLPVLRKELGDVWLFGVASDPLRVARYRELARSLQGLDIPREARREASRALLLVAEHTWGLDTMVQLTDIETWRKPQFAAARTTARWQRFETSWAEQRAYIDQALDALPAPARALAAERLAGLTPTEFDELPDDSDARAISTDRLRLRVDDRGAIVELHDRETGVDWASPDAPLGLFVYEVFDSGIYEEFWAHGMNPVCRDLWWPHYACGKRGLETLGRFAQAWHPEVVGSRAGDGLLDLRLQLPAVASDEYGGPRELEIAIHADGSDVELDLRWRDKDAIRVPEAAWMTFVPPVERETWRFEKLGLDIDPTEVIEFGGRLHAVDRVRARSSQGAFELVTPDAPLVSLERKILPGPADVDANELHVNLLNTVWSTNYTQWYDDDARFRFRLRLGRT